MAFDLAASPLQIWTDCTSAIQYFNRGLAWASDGSRSAASIWRSIAQRHPDVSRVCSSMQHVKAHRADDAALDACDAARIKGNRLADEFAKRGATLHLPDDDCILRHRLLMHRVRLVTRHISACLELWPAPRIEHRIARRRRRVAARRPIGHYPTDLVWSANRWRCPACCSSFSVLPQRPCPGESATFKKILGTDRGHRLWSACVADGTFLMYCKGCGCSSSSKGVGLLRHCPGPVAGTYGVTTGLKRLAKGLHPWKAMSISKPWPVQICVPLPAPCRYVFPDAPTSTSMLPVIPCERANEPTRDIEDLLAQTAAGDGESQSDDAA